MLTDEMIDTLMERMMAIQEEDAKRSDVPRLEKALADVERRRSNILKAIEAGAFAPELNDRLADLAEEADALRVEIEREKIKKPQIPKEFLRQWLVSFRDGSVLDDDFAERMADAFLYSVKCYEDHVVVAFNVLGDADGRLVSTLSLEVDFLNLRSNTPTVFWPFIILRIDLTRK